MNIKEEVSTERRIYNWGKILPALIIHCVANFHFPTSNLSAKEIIGNEAKNEVLSYLVFIRLSPGNLPFEGADLINFHVWTGVVTPGFNWIKRWKRVCGLLAFS